MELPLNLNFLICKLRKIITVDYIVRVLGGVN